MRPIIIMFLSFNSMIGYGFNIKEMYFIANAEQWDKRVLFKAEGDGTIFWFLKDGYLSEIISAYPENKEVTKYFKKLNNNAEDEVFLKTQVINWILVNSSPNVQILGLDTLTHYSNYFLGNEPTKWKTNIPHFRKILYKEVYQGIDLQFSIINNSLKYEFIIKPYADPSRIRIKYSGIDFITATPEGGLKIMANGVQFNECFPHIYQVKGNERSIIQGQYKLFTDGTIGFVIEEYDKKIPLIIDPLVTIAYSTYLGGSSYESGNAVAIDSLGFAYIAGYTMSTNFPVQNPYQGYNAGSFDIFVSKFNTTGNQLLYSTYIGGTDEDVAYGLKVDASGIYICGRTSSNNFPISNAFQSAHGGGTYDAFLTKLRPDGILLLFSTYLGGNANDEAMDVAVDRNNCAYIVGKTASGNFPLNNPFQNTYGGGYYDGFLTKFTSQGTQLSYSTYLGGSALDECWSIAVDSSGYSYVTGYTSSFNFPVHNFYQQYIAGENDAFVTKFTPSGNSLVFSTYFGGSLYDYGQGIAIDNFGNVYFTGGTESDDFPIRNPFQGNLLGVDAFVAKLGTGGNQLIFSTYLGGSNFDYGQDIAVDGSGCAYIIGYTNSVNFPLFNPFQGYYGGGYYDAFVTKFVPTGDQLSYSSYLGGSSTDVGYSIAIDTGRCAYLTGHTESTNFPIQNPFQGTKSGATDAYLTKLNVDNTNVEENVSFWKQSFVRIQPNPFYDNAYIYLISKTNQWVKLEVFDVIGSKVDDICSQSILSGVNCIKLKTKDLNPGIYFVKILFDNGETTILKGLKLK